MERTFIAVAAIAIVLVAAGGVWLYGTLNHTQSSLRATEAHLRQKSATLTATRAELHAVALRHNGVVEVLNDTLADLSAERLTRNQLQQDKNDLQSDNTAIVANNSALTGSLQTLSSENATLTADLAAAGRRGERLTAELVAETTAHTSTKAALSAQEAEHGELLSLHGDVEALRGEIAVLREQRTPLLLKTDRDDLACTGSMEPKLTCLDEVTILRNYDPADIVVGSVIVYLGEKECVLRGPVQHLFGNRYRPCTQYQRPLIIHRVMEIGPTSYLTKGDANTIEDGWTDAEDVVGYLIQVHRNVNPENAPLRAAVMAAKGALDLAENALIIAEAAYEARVNDYCGGNAGCTVYYYDESDPIYVTYQAYEGAFKVYERALNTYECWFKNAVHSQYPGHIPYSCN